MARRILLLAAFLLALAAGPAGAAEEKVLNVYNWSDYIAPDTIADFEKETGIDVRYDVYDSNEVLEGKLLAGQTGYDIVVPTGPFLARQIAAGVFRPLDKDKLTNWDNLDPELMERLEAYDPGNLYAIPYMWGTTGFGYDAAKIAARMENAPVQSWDMIFDPEVVKNFADCGVTLLDAPNEVIDIALNYLGRDPNSTDPADLKAVEDLLMKIRPYVRYFHSSQYIDDLANGEICLAMGWSGDIFQAIDDAAEGREIRYTIPEEGTVIWFDLMAIPADAPHPDNAHLFLNHILQPEVVAEISNTVFYANPNRAATPLVNEEIRTNPSIYPSAEVRGHLFAEEPVPAGAQRARTRLWTRVTTGR